MSTVNRQTVAPRSGKGKRCLQNRYRIPRYCQFQISNPKTTLSRDTDNIYALDKRLIRLRYFWLIFSLVATMNGSLAQSSQMQVIELSCVNSAGCFFEIQQAIDSSPAGSKIKMGPGTYYERPLIINRSISLIGAGSSSTHIRIVDRGAGISIVSLTEMRVELAGIDIQMPDIWDVNDSNSRSLGIYWTRTNTRQATNSFCYRISSKAMSTSSALRSCRGIKMNARCCYEWSRKLSQFSARMLSSSC